MSVECMWPCYGAYKLNNILSNPFWQRVPIRMVTSAKTLELQKEESDSPRFASADADTSECAFLTCSFFFSHFVLLLPSVTKESCGIVRRDCSSDVFGVTKALLLIKVSIWSPTWTDGRHFGLGGHQNRVRFVVFYFRVDRRGLDWRRLFSTAHFLLFRRCSF